MSGKKASWAKVFGRLFTSGALLGSLLTMGWETARPAMAVDSCTSGSKRTYSVTGRTFRFGYERDFGEIFDDQKAHQFTVVEFSSDGVNDALCSWTAPKGIKGSQLAVVGGGGAGGTIGGGGGGGGGVFINKLSPIVGNVTYDITVGRGGVAREESCNQLCNGEHGRPSSVSSSGETIASAGGGGGGGGNGS